jgi:uncharacterized protein (TIGR02421 family)
METIEMISEALLHADRVLLEAAVGLRLVPAVRPTNEAEEKRAFLAGKTRVPTFRYKPPRNRSYPELRSLRLPENELGRLLEAQRLRLLKLETVLGSGAQQGYRQISREIYGSPHPHLFPTALRILKRLPAVPRPETTLERVKAELEHSLVRFGLTGWRVDFAPGDFTAARAMERQVLLTSVGPVFEGTGLRLAVHEVGVHALRAQNGFAQPLAIFGYGLPGYERTEEGLATYAEVLTGSSDARVIRNYASRAIAVVGLDKGWDFRQGYEELRALGQSDHQAWEATLRAHRGGGFIKDHIYLDGLLEMVRFASSGEDLRLLFMGKIGVQHLPLIQECVRAGSLRPASLLPDFLSATPPPSEVWSLLKSLA